jgi:hypothetical protein
MCDCESLPAGGRKPAPYVLTLLACAYNTDVRNLLGYDDHRTSHEQTAS